MNFLTENVWISRKIWLKFESRIFQNWFRWWLGADLATSHYLNQWWSSLITHICVTRPQWVNDIFCQGKLYSVSAALFTVLCSLVPNAVYQFRNLYVVKSHRMTYGRCRVIKFQSNVNLFTSKLATLQWRHNEPDCVSNHQPHDCLVNRLFRRRSKKTSKLRVTGLCAGNSPGTAEFPAQRASDAENVSIWWRHHEF